MLRLPVCRLDCSSANQRLAPENLSLKEKCILQAITATSQQSRFHSETLETCCEDVDLKGVNLLVGDQELLADAALRLFSGVHYGLIGANGVGKCAACLFFMMGSLVLVPTC